MTDLRATVSRVVAENLDQIAHVGTKCQVCQSWVIADDEQPPEPHKDWCPIGQLSAALQPPTPSLEQLCEEWLKRTILARPNDEHEGQRYVERCVRRLRGSCSGQDFIDQMMNFIQRIGSGGAPPPPAEGKVWIHHEGRWRQILVTTFQRLSSRRPPPAEEGTHESKNGAPTVTDGSRTRRFR